MKQISRAWPNAEKLDLMIEVEEAVSRHGATGDRVEFMLMLRDMAPELLRMARWSLTAMEALQFFTEPGTRFEQREAKARAALDACPVEGE